MAVSRLLPAIAVVSIALAARGASAAGDAISRSKRKEWVEIHGWLMWSSMGILLPVGVILLRYSRNQRDPVGAVSHARVSTLFYMHAIILSIAAILALGGMLLLIVKLGPFWDYTHERLGLALVVLMLLQPFVGLARPGKYNALRPYWYLLHWTLGTGSIFLGILNTYIGMNVYEKIFQTSIRSLKIAYSVVVSFMGLAYLLQDRWHYVFRNSRFTESNPKTDPNYLNGGSISY